jgi:DNA-binding NarL/FixJ family response regulator
MLRVFIADDHDTCRLALKLTVLLVKKYEIVGESSSGRKLVEEILEKDPDVAIVDLSLPHKNGFDVSRAEKKRLQSEVYYLDGTHGCQNSRRVDQAGCRRILVQGRYSERHGKSTKRRPCWESMD